MATTKERMVDRSETQEHNGHAPLARREEAAPLAVRQEPPTIAGILAAAVDKGMNPESIDKLLAVYERMEAKTAAREAAEDLAKFQSECPVIAKTASAKIVTKAGGSYSYNYAPLDTIANTIRKHLMAYGLSYSWDSSDLNGTITCTCTVRHVNGHTFSAKFACPTDTAAAMSGAQKNAAALTFARRQSLIQALGLTTGDPDNDAAPASKGPTVTQSQAADIQVLADEVGANIPAMLQWLEVDRIVDIPAARHKEVISKLEQKRRQS